MHATRAFRLPSRMSTNVRLFGARLGFSTLSRVSPAVAAAAAERLFFTPARPRRSRGQAVLSRGHAFTVRASGQRLAAWRFGHGPAVLLLHGWSGRAAQLTSFVAPLVDAGFSVVAFDAPGHGGSDRGLSSAPQFARALRAVAAVVGPLHAVVAHSLGAAATALAMRDGLDVGRVVFLAPPANPPAWVASFAARLGIPAPVIERMRERSERRLRLRWKELDVPALATERSTPLLVVHDRGDAEVDFRDGQDVAAAWLGAVLVETNGLGHNRLLRDPGVVSRVVAFVASGARPRCPHCGRPLAATDEPCEQCRIERDLFERETRGEGAGRGA